jgi:Zn finger protein HypA/HybF involved in hydrogenase expression
MYYQCADCQHIMWLSEDDDECPHCGSLDLEPLGDDANVEQES